MGYGIPYMGSKQGIADSICLNFPKAEHFYDLFGGGGSITHCMMLHRAKNHAHFHYNELNPLVADLFKRAVNGEFSYDRFIPEWISKEDFHARKGMDGYIQCLWSFGNERTTYLFGEEIEPYKKSMHMAVVFEEFDSLATEVLGFSKWPREANTITKRRIYLRQKLSWYNEKKKIPKVLYQFLSEKQLRQMGAKDNVKQLEQLQQLERLEQLQRLQSLEQLERLERLQSLQQLERLSITSYSYERVEIKPNSVVYCDIPYKGTADYGVAFNHKAFFDWAASRDFPVYISEYEVRDPRFDLVYSIDKRSLLSAEDNKLIKSEKLYWNRVRDGTESIGTASEGPAGRGISPSILMARFSGSGKENI